MKIEVESKAMAFIRQQGSGFVAGDDKWAYNFAPCAFAINNETNEVRLVTLHDLPQWVKDSLTKEHLTGLPFETDIVDPDNAKTMDLKDYLADPKRTRLL